MNAVVNIASYQDNLHFDQVIDARGLSCPLPVFSTKASVEKIKPGEIVKILTTDKNSSSFFESLVRQTGLELLSWNEQNGEFVFFLGKS